MHRVRIKGTIKKAKESKRKQRIPTMVAISLYRGNLHRVPDVQRRWQMPTPQISLKDFRLLLARRAKALSRLRSSITTTTDAIPSSNPNSNPHGNSNYNANIDLVPTQQQSNAITIEEERSNVSRPEEAKKAVADFKEENNLKPSDGGWFSAKPVDGSDSLPDLPEGSPAKVDGGANANSQAVQFQKIDESTNPNTERMKKEDAVNDKQKRKREVEEKLEVLKDKKHNLVQALKQILKAEDELKKRNRPPVPLQVVANNDSESIGKQVTPRTGLEANNAGDMEGGETDYLSNHNNHSRPLLRMNSTSPSSESPIRRPLNVPCNMVPHPSRTSLGATGSPSRFAPVGQHQGHPANLPTLSVSGTNYIASSPSPAASGGTSTFRDSRLPSPWS